MAPSIGFGLRPENRHLLADPSARPAVEITLEHADDPLRIDRFLAANHPPYVSIHSLELSLSSPVTPPEEYMDTLNAIALENDATAVSDHLGFTRDSSGKHAMGHFAPPPFSPDALRATRRNVEWIQNRLSGLPFYVENIAYFFALPGPMSEAEFLRRLMADTGCGWLLDVTNLYANSINHGYDARAFLDEVMPVASSVQMHLAGGFMDRKSKFYIDSHSEPVPQPVWDLYDYALQLGRGKVEAVFIERDDNFPQTQGWLDELDHARRIAVSVGE
jgi:uncharacterized protein (UPF0276 family)